MKINIKSLILIAALLVPTLLYSAPTTKATGDNFYFDPTPTTGHVASTASVNVKLDAFTNLNAYQFTFRWDQTILKFSSITFVYLHTVGSTANNYAVSIVGNSITAAEWFTDPAGVVSSSNQILATITWNVLSGGECVLNMTAHTYWHPDLTEPATTATNGYFYTYEPYVAFTNTPSAPRAGETVTFDGSASRATQMAIGDFNGDGVVDSTDLGTMGSAWNAFLGDLNYNPACDLNGDGVVDSTDLGILGAHWNEYGNYITGYKWWIDGVDPPGSETLTTSFASYSKIPHNVTLVVTDSYGYSYALEKDITVNRDLAMFSIWPSYEDYEGSINTTIPIGKYVIVYGRWANIGTITEYTDNSKGDFPSTTAYNLYLVHSVSGVPDMSTAELLATRAGKKLRRYYVFPDANFADAYFAYDWAPVVGVGYGYYWDTAGRAPENDLYFYANLTHVAGDTDATNDFLWFGPFNLTAGFDHDIRIEGTYTNDAVDYYHPYGPFPSTTALYYYGPYGSSDLVNVSVDITNNGIYNETNVHVWLSVGSNTGPMVVEAYVNITIGQYLEVDLPGFASSLVAGTSTNIYAHVDPVPGETSQWNTWDNNVPGQAIAFFNAYDTWGTG